MSYPLTVALRAVRLDLARLATAGDPAAAQLARLTGWRPGWRSVPLPRLGLGARRLEPLPRPVALGPPQGTLRLETD